MKLSHIIAVTAMFFATWVGGGVQALETPASVQSEGGQVTPPLCSKAVLRQGNGRLQVEFQVKDLPQYNRYQLYLGDTELVQKSDDPQGSPDLKDVAEGGATWLVVVDTSDPAGRPYAIEQEKQAMIRLHTFMSKASRVQAYSLSRELRLLPGRDCLPARGEGLRYPVAGISPKGRWGWAPHAGECSRQLFQDVTSAANANTYLWVGLSKVIKEELPKLATGPYANRPKGIILLSDGVDESPNTSEDLARLVKEAKEAGVVIHTIGYPNKDRAKGASKTALHKGFSALQRLSVETGGTFLTYEDVAADGPQAKELERVVLNTETNLLSVDLPITAVNPGNNLSLRLWEGSNSLHAVFTISQYDVAKVFGDCYLHALCELAEEVRKEEDNQKTEEGINNLGAGLIRYILPLPIRDELFSYTDADEPFVKRVRQILAVLDAHPEMMKKLIKSVQDDKQHSSNLIHQVGVCLYSMGAPLPEPEKEIVDNRPVIINTSQEAASSASLAEDDSIQDWVWWSLGVGGSAFAILFFWIIVKIFNKLDGGGSAGHNHVGMGGSAKPALAYLVNKGNPAQRWSVTSTSCRVGRSRSCDVALPSHCSFVSSTHFMLKSTDGSWELRDANSTNGTMVNGNKVMTCALNDGDVIRIGDLELEFKIR